MGFGHLPEVGCRTLISFNILYQFCFYISEEVLEPSCAINIIDCVADNYCICKDEMDCRKDKVSLCVVWVQHQQVVV